MTHWTERAERVMAAWFNCSADEFRRDWKIGADQESKNRVAQEIQLLDMERRQEEQVCEDAGKKP